MVRLGTSYYPERTDPTAWSDDAALMAESGLSLVRMGEFAWSALEPARGRYRWDWLDDAVAAFGGAGLSIVLATPTAAPPVWLARESPEILSVGSDLRARQYGSRRHVCPTAPAYRAASERIAAALAERYGRHPAVVAWQLDNEPGNHDSGRCWCTTCQGAFGEWLEGRYGDVETLNRVWGTGFWSGEYGSFDAVELPRPTVAAHNPSLLLAHRRFSSRQMGQLVAGQARIVGRLSPGRDLFTNSYLSEIDVDPALVAAPGTLAAHDSYPTALDDPLETSFVHDLCRGLGRGRFWVAEQQPGPINWTALNPPVAPGQVRVWSWQAAMHGAEVVLFFPWRQARSGPEQYHAALLDHGGRPTRALDEVRRLAGELAAAPAELFARPAGAVALLWSYEDAAALEISPQRQGLGHRRLVLAAYTAARRLGFEVDVVDPSEPELSSYALVLAPALHLAGAARLSNLSTALEAGSTVILGPRALVKDEEHCWIAGDVPGGLAERLGGYVREHLSQTLDVTVAEFDNCPAGPWTDVLEATDGRVLARYGGGTHLDGSPAAIERDGLAYAGFSSPAAWLGLLGALAVRAGLNVPEPLPEGTESFSRPGGRVTIDHAALEVDLPQPRRGAAR